MNWWQSVRTWEIIKYAFIIETTKESFAVQVIKHACGIFLDNYYCSFIKTGETLLI